MSIVPARFAANILLLAVTACGALAAGRAQAQPAPFTHEVVKAEAAALAAKPYKATPEALPKGLESLEYDQFRQIRFRKERTIWRGDDLNFELQLLPMGWLFKTPVEINIVESGNVQPLTADNAYFDMGPLAGKLPPDARMGFSGFRITSPLNRPDVFDEVIVFQGASYFRALSRGQSYGLSARGLALNVGQPSGEEFPLFKKFWIEKPAIRAGAVVIHALLDSPSVAGAYRFVVTPGAPTVIAVMATLYPRQELANPGIAPLTSMYLFGANNRTRISDFRSAVHDSDGLAMLNGWGEHIWRPLTNPRRLQTSHFIDQNPKGFGLMQRARNFRHYQDLEAGYERRPSAWVAPAEDWGPGAVELFELPTEEEIHDNIVAFWKPAQPLAANKPYTFSYTLSWPDEVPTDWGGAKVLATRIGLINGPRRKSGTQQFVVDFGGLPGLTASEPPVAKLEASAGAVGVPIVQPNPEIGGLRVSFTFDAKGAQVSEMRLVLMNGQKAVSETWLYRWTNE